MDINNRNINWDNHKDIDWFVVVVRDDVGDAIKNFNEIDWLDFDVTNVADVKRVDSVSFVDCLPTVDVTDVKSVDVDVVKFGDAVDDFGFVNAFVGFDCVDANDAVIFGTDGDDAVINVVVIAVDVDDDEVNCFLVFESENVKDVEGTIEHFDFVDSDVTDIMGNASEDVAPCNVIWEDVESTEESSLLNNFTVRYGTSSIRGRWMETW